MALRVKLKISSKSGGKAVASSALVNTGFETDRPQLLLPVRIASLLGIWPRFPEHTSIMSYGTAGGPTRVYVINDELSLSLGYDDVPPKQVTSDAVISEVEDEVLVSDSLGHELGIVIEDLKIGYWRLREEPSTKLRNTEPPQYW